MRGCLNLTMIKSTFSALVVAALLAAAVPAFAGEHACCAKGAHANKVACADFANLNLTADQKTKLESWQADCIKAGCTKQSRDKFLTNAKGILSADQYAKLKERSEER